MKIMRALKWTWCCLVALMCLNLTVEAKEKPSQKMVLISQFVDHPALNKTVDGIIEELAAQGFKDDDDGCVIRTESAQANPSLAMQIAAKFANRRPDVMVGVGTISAQSMAQWAIIGRSNLVFSSVTDPKAAGLVCPDTKHKINITGVSNFIPIRPQLELMKKIQPNLKKVGILYNAGEVNSTFLVTKIEEIARTMDMEVVRQAVVKTTDVVQAAHKLATQVDAVFITNDNTALSCFVNIVQVCNHYSVPVYVSDVDIVESGAIAALGPDQYLLGRQTGRMIARILNGEDINDIAIETPHEVSMVINLEAAKLCHISIAQDVLDMADEIIGEE